MLYCPRCSDVLDPDPNVGCRRGGMPLSPQLHQRLLALAGDGSTPAPASSVPFEIGGTWFCPLCATLALEPEPGTLRCRGCKHFLSHLVLDLVEFHPHDRLVVQSRIFRGEFSNNDVSTLFLEVVGVRAHERNTSWFGGTIDGISYELVRLEDREVALIVRIERSGLYPASPASTAPAGFSALARVLRDSLGLEPL